MNSIYFRLSTGTGGFVLLSLLILAFVIYRCPSTQTCRGWPHLPDAWMQCKPAVECPGDGLAQSGLVLATQERSQQEDDGGDAGAVWQHRPERGALLRRLLVPLPGAAHVQQGAVGRHAHTRVHARLLPSAEAFHFAILAQHISTPSI